MTDAEFNALLLVRWASAIKLMQTHPRIQEMMKQMEVGEEIKLFCSLHSFLSDEDKLWLLQKIEKSSPGFLKHLLENPKP